MLQFYTGTIPTTSLSCTSFSFVLVTRPHSRDQRALSPPPQRDVARLYTDTKVAIASTASPLSATCTVRPIRLDEVGPYTRYSTPKRTIEIKTYRYLQSVAYLAAYFAPTFTAVSSPTTALSPAPSTLPRCRPTVLLSSGS